MDTDALIAFLQNEVNKTMEENSQLKKKCEDARCARIDMMVSRGRMNASQEDAKKHRIETRKIQNELWKRQRDLEKCQNDLEVRTVELGEAQRAGKQAKISLEANQALHDTDKQDLDFHKAMLEEKMKEVSRNQKKLEVKQRELERMRSLQLVTQEQHRLLLQRFNIVGSQLKSATTQRDAFSADIVRHAKTISEKDSFIFSLQDKQRGLQQASDDTSGVLKTIKIKHESLKIQHATQMKELEELRKGLEEKDAIISDLRDKAAQIEKDLSDKQALVERQNTELGSLHVTVKNEQNLIAKVEESLKETNAAISKHQNEEKALKDKVCELEASQAELSKTRDAEFAKQTVEIEDLKKNLGIIIWEKNKLEADVARFKDQETELRQNHEVDVKEKEELKNQATKLQSKISELEHKQETIAEINSKTDAKMASLGQQHQKAVEDLQQTHAADMKALRQQHEKDTAEVRSNAIQKDEGATRLTSEVADLKGRLQEREEELRDDQRTIQSYVNGKEILEKKIQEVEEELKRTEEDKNAEMTANVELQVKYDAQFELNEQNSAEIEKLKSHLKKATEESEQAQLTHTAEVGKVKRDMNELRSLHSDALHLKDRELAAQARAIGEQDDKTARRSSRLSGRNL